jgi:hypothetical protein
MRAIKYVYLIFSFLLLSSFGASSLSQTIHSEIKALSKGADVILTGKVVKQKSSWDENKTRIFTKATLQVNEYLKGNNSDKALEVIYPGGEVGEVGELYTHMPKFVNDEEVLVFLKKDNKNASYKVLNGEDGKITVIKDEKTGEEVTSSNVKIKNLKAQIKSFLNEK